MPNFPSPGHEAVIGATGMGKTYWLLYKILRSFEIGRAMTVFTPKSDLYYAILSYFLGTRHGRSLWQKFRHRILFVNPVSPSDYIVGFNAIAPIRGNGYVHADTVALVASSMVSFIAQQSGFGMFDAQRMQAIMDAAIGLLLSGGMGRFTLNEIPLLFLPGHKEPGDKQVPAFNNFTRHLLDFCDHEGTKEFWYEEWKVWYDKERREWTESSRDRIFRYLFNDRARATLCTVKNATLDFDQVVSEGFWVFVHIPYNWFGPDVSALLGNVIASKIHYAAARFTLRDNPYRLMIDEAWLFNSGPLYQVLDLARYHKLWLTLAVQNLDQLCLSASGIPDQRLKDSVRNQCRYYSVFQSEKDAELLASWLYPATGAKVAAIHANGNRDYVPVQAEKDQAAAFLRKLAFRQVVLYDKDRSLVTRPYYTPNVYVPKVPFEELIYFESEHLSHTGRPLAEIQREIEGREAGIRFIMDEGEGKRAEDFPKPTYGEKL